ncbi:MAG: DUF1846 domain-containing protein [Bacilli bacterium]|nr:DUF1846 domain-containing protein [Bacilli bacterium]
MSAFNNEKYLELQAKKISERIAKFNNKLYLEFGGKIFDDYHASRVLPGFESDSKVQMLFGLRDKVEIIITISAGHIQTSKMRGDYGISYEDEVFRMIESFNKMNLYVGSVVVTKYNKEPAVKVFGRKLAARGIPLFYHYQIDGYPVDTDKIVSEEGFGKNDYVKTTRSLIVVTAPGPGSGKMATCLSQLYHENKNGIRAGYAKYETFPIWNLALKHPVNLAYEAATADLNDVNMIDPFHLNAYNELAVNYNRDVEVYPILEALFKKIYGECPYKSPTDMGVNMVGFCIEDEEAVTKACEQEVIRRYFETKLNVLFGKTSESVVKKQKLIMGQLGVHVCDRPIVDIAMNKAEKEQRPVLAMKMPDGTVITGKQSSLLTATSAAILNSIKYLSGIKDKLKLISPNVFEPLQKLKREVLQSDNLRLNAQDLITALSISATTNPIVEEALEMLKELKGIEAHSTVVLSYEDAQVLKSLKINLTQEAILNN